MREANIFEILFLDAPLTIEGARFVLIFLGLLLEPIEVAEVVGVELTVHHGGDSTVGGNDA